MRLCAIVDLFNESSQAPNDWLRVDDQNEDHGFTLVCKRDVFLCLSIKPVVVAKKPYSRIQLAYGSTIISWADLPVLPSAQDHAEILAATKKQLAPL